MAEESPQDKCPKFEYPKVEFRQDSTKKRDDQWNHYDSKEFAIRFSSGQYVPIPNFYETFQTHVSNHLKSTMPMGVLLSWFEFKYFIGIIPCVEFRLSWYACNLVTGAWSKVDPEKFDELYSIYDSIMKACESKSL
jgi:hypothetical protein